jgi:hypothetical protein
MKATPLKTKLQLKIWIALGIAVASCVPTLAQTQAQQNRLDLVAKFIVTAPMCERLGMTLDSALPTKAAAAFETETAAWKIDTSTLNRLAGEAISRQGNILKTDLNAVSEGAKTDAQLRDVRSVLLEYGKTCVAATNDSIFSTLIVSPDGYDLEAEATKAADKMLEGGGLASWQTPSIQARGDLMMIAGACRSKIGAARSDALVTEFGQSDEARERDYYNKTFDDGLADPDLISTLAGCNRAIATTREKIRKNAP